MSPLKERDGDESWDWPKKEEVEDVESAYTMSEEPTVPPTPVEYDENGNPDRTIQKERASSGFDASVSTSHSILPHCSSLPPPSPALSRVAWLNTAILVVYSSEEDNIMDNHPSRSPSKIMRLRFLQAVVQRNADSLEGVCDTYSGASTSP